MGTNFYLRGHRHSDSPEDHIGKRSAAGLYCWDCRVTLIEGGESNIHRSGSRVLPACPRCGKKPTPRGAGDMMSGPVARELGFDKSPPKARTGVDGCSSFRWAMDPERVLAKGADLFTKCRSCGQSLPEPLKVIEDEYGELYTLDEFKAVLEECPVRFLDSVGVAFS